MAWKKTLKMLAALLGVAVLAGAITPKNLASDLRTFDFTVAGYAAFVSTSSTAGTDGVIWSEVIDAATEDATAAELVAPPYAGRLDVRINDDGSDGTPTCTSATIWGVSSRGYSVREVVSSINEAENLTKYSYESVSDIDLAGCAGYAGFDGIVVSVTDHIAVPVSIASNADIVAVCKRDAATASNTWVCKDGSAMTVNRTANSVDIGSGSLSPTDGDLIRIRGRAPRR